MVKPPEPVLGPLEGPNGPFIRTRGGSKRVFVCQKKTKTTLRRFRLSHHCVHPENGGGDIYDSV